MRPRSGARTAGCGLLYSTVDQSVGLCDANKPCTIPSRAGAMLTGFSRRGRLSAASVRRIVVSARPGKHHKIGDHGRKRLSFPVPTNARTSTSK